MLSRRVTRFSLDYDQKCLMKWPRIPVHFPALKSFHVAPGSEPSDLWNVIPDLDVSILPQSLTSISLLCPNAMIAFLRYETLKLPSKKFSFTDIGAVFPNLEKLVLSGIISSRQAVSLDPKHLPRSLKHLEFVGRKGPNVKASSLISLPPALEHITMNLVDDLEGDYSTAVLPSTLTNMTLSIRHTIALIWLTKAMGHVRTLDLTVQDNFYDEDETVYEFPPGVTDLTIYGFSLTMETVNIIIPPTLRRLSIDGYVEREAMAHLPATLTSIKLASMAIDHIGSLLDLGLPSSLTEFIGIEHISLPITSWEGEIPKWLTSIETNALPPEDSQEASNGDYEDPKVCDAMMRALNEKLKDQIVDHRALILDGHRFLISDTMSRLTSLDIDTNWDSSPDTLNTDWMKWCPSLTVLNVSIPMDLILLAQAPFRLKKLLLSMPAVLLQEIFSEVGNNGENGLEKSKALLWDHHPSLAPLTELTLFLSDPSVTTGKSIWTGRMLSSDFLVGLLSHLPQGLTDLTVAAHLWQSEPTSPSVPSSIFARLPRGLRSLTLDEIDILPPHFNHTDLRLLPCKLVTLKLSASEWTQNLMRRVRPSESDLSAKSTEIEAPIAFSDLNGAELADLLPKGLATLQIPYSRFDLPTLAFDLELKIPLLRRLTKQQNGDTESINVKSELIESLNTEFLYLPLIS